MRPFLFLLFLFASSQAMAATPAAPPAQARVTFIRNFGFTKIRDLDFGTLIRTTLSANRTVTISRTGVVTCAAEIVCTGAPQSAGFNVRGPLNVVAIIRTQASTLSNGTATIAFTPNAPGLVVLLAPIAAGTNFDVGGSVTLLPATPDGSYVGDLLITAEFI